MNDHLLNGPVKVHTFERMMISKGILSNLIELNHFAKK